MENSIFLIFTFPSVHKMAGLAWVAMESNPDMMNEVVIIFQKNIHLNTSIIIYSNYMVY